VEKMRKILFAAFTGFIVLTALSMGTILTAQLGDGRPLEPRGNAEAEGRPSPTERRPAGMGKGPLIVLGGLKLQKGADPDGAEKLLKEDLIPKMTGVEGMKVRVLKNVKMNLTGYDDPSAQESDKAAYDYVMMAEIENLGVLMKFMRKSYRGEKGLSAFGDLMKEFAGKPYINSYTVIAETEDITETE
jgi:hypothetical protein